MLKDVLENLKNRKFYNYDMSPIITVYASSETITKLRQNKENWQSQRNNDTYYHYCKMEQYNGYELSERCKRVLRENDTYMDD